MIRRCILYKQEFMYIGISKSKKFNYNAYLLTVLKVLEFEFLFYFYK